MDLLTKPVDARDVLAAIQRTVTKDEHDRAAETELIRLAREAGVSAPKA